jgi:hypothetical protein
MTIPRKDLKFKTKSKKLLIAQRDRDMKLEWAKSGMVGYW